MRTCRTHAAIYFASQQSSKKNGVLISRKRETRLWGSSLSCPCDPWQPLATLARRGPPFSRCYSMSEWLVQITHQVFVDDQGHRAGAALLKGSGGFLHRARSRMRSLSLLSLFPFILWAGLFHRPVMPGQPRTISWCMGGLLKCWWPEELGRAAGIQGRVASSGPETHHKGNVL